MAISVKERIVQAVEQLSEKDPEKSSLISSKARLIQRLP